jgi:hypothetical protein
MTCRVSRAFACPTSTVPREDAVQHERVDVDVQVEGYPEPLDHGRCAPTTIRDAAVARAGTQEAEHRAKERRDDGNVRSDVAGFPDVSSLTDMPSRFAGTSALRGRAASASSPYLRNGVSRTRPFTIPGPRTMSGTRRPPSYR